MDKLAILVLVVTTGLSIFNMIVILVTNYKFRERMSGGGKVVLRLADASAGISILIVMINIIVLILEIFDSENSGTLFFAFGLLISALDIAIITRFRGYQNQKISQALARNQQILEERNKIMANISHEIRTPMNTIMGINEILLNDSSIPDVYREKLKSVSDASSALLHVVNNLIDFTKIESRHLDIIETNYVLKELLQNIISASRSPIVEKNIDFKITVNEDIPSVLHGDDIRIIQVITNILDNACKFTNSGLIATDVNFEKIAADKVNLVFSIQDTGMGIPDKEKPFVFNTSTVNTSRDDHRQKGAGLGLLISKSIIDKMGGEISYETERGVGTKFIVKIPQMVVDANPIGKFGSAEANSGLYMFKAAGAKALVVDDNIVNLFVAKEILEKYDIEVQTATGGAECLDIVCSNVFDIIFMDYVMPGMDGNETLKKLRDMDFEYLKNVPVIALTAQTMSGAEKVYRDEGFDGYLSKPLKVDNLEEVLLNNLPGRFITKKAMVAQIVDDPEIEKQSWFQRLKNVLESVDVKKGLGFCGNDYFSYINLLRVIYNDGMNQINKLKFACDQKNMEEYRITVHAMKSVTASAGDDALSEKCKIHEQKAKENDSKFISENFSSLIDDYKKLLGEIDVALRRESELRTKGAKKTKKINEGSEKIDHIIRELDNYLESFDVDEAEKMLEQLEGINLTSEQERVLANVHECLSLFDYDAARKELRKCWEKLF